MSDGASAPSTPPPTIERGVERVLTLLLQPVSVVCEICVAGLIAVTGWQVFGRYVLNDPPTWAENSSMLIILVITFVGAALCVREGDHLRITLIADKLPPKGRQVLDFAVTAILIVFGAAMASGGATAAIQVWNVPDSMLPVSRGAYFLPVAIAGALMVAILLPRLITGTPAKALEPEDGDDEWN